MVNRDRRFYLKTLGAGIASGLGWEVFDERKPGMKASKFFLSELDERLEPGEEVSWWVRRFLMIPDNYQELIDPSQVEETSLEDLYPLEYRPDLTDWKTPQEFLEEGGDCEDFSTAAASVLEAEDAPLNYKVVLGTVDAGGHTAVEIEGGYFTSFKKKYGLGESWNPVLEFSSEKELQAYTGHI
ncbi:MAG: hypothetical protein ABEJ66_02705 [Candidatus Nanohaloarchaea archaeon]